MLVLLRLLLGFVIWLTWTAVGNAQAPNCHNVNPTAHQSLHPAGSPPARSYRCTFRLKNGIPTPDPACTPGAINPTVTADVLGDDDYDSSCAIASGLSASERKASYDWYHVNEPSNDTTDTQTCLLDHLVPLELGGADSLDNMWPLCGPPRTLLTKRYFELKNLVDDYLAIRVRSGNMQLSEAQQGIAADWTRYLEAAQRPRTVIVHRTANVRRTHRDQQIVDMLIASSRVMEPNPGGGALELEPTNLRSEQLTFGKASVRVPDGHDPGEIERPYFEFLVRKLLGSAFEKKYFSLQSTRWLSRSEFLDEINNSGADQALVFVHGFNTTLQDGLFRLAQIVYDSHFSGLPILFSWPSQGGGVRGVRSYFYDENSAQFSVDGFRELIKLLQDDKQIAAIHVIAHSMGNRIVVGAFGDPGSSVEKKSLGQLILAAPDVDEDVFKLQGSRITGFRGVTMYGSSKDWALSASRALAEFGRAGYTIPDPVVLPNIYTIDASILGAGFFDLNHDTFAESSALCDIGRLLENGQEPPSQRTPVIKADKRYWKYAKSDPTWTKKGCQ